MIITILALSGLAGLAPAADLVMGGKPRSEIIVAEKPARMTKLAASNLQEYVSKMTGATLPITSTPSQDVPVKIFVGKSKFTDELKLSTEDLAHGAFRMVSGTKLPGAAAEVAEAGWLALLGPDKDFVPMEPYAHGVEWNKDKHRALKDWDAANPGEYYGFPYYRLGYNSYSPELDIWEQDDGGTLNAVCEFLRSLGVRWYFPGELGEVVPKKSSIAFAAMDKTVTPDFPMRRLGYWSDTWENKLWNLRMGVNFGQEMMGLVQNCHGSKWVYMRDEIKKAHPDWYSLQNGKRLTNHSYSGAPCLSSEGLFKKHLQFARMIFDVRKEPMLSLDACDGYGSCMCQCDLCKGKDTPERGRRGTLSDYVWGYVNRVAKELYKSHPKHMVSGLSYSSYRLPPEKIDKLSPNLALVMCQGRSSYFDRDLRASNLVARQAWLDILPSKEIYIYDYYVQNCPGSGRSDIPVYFPRLIAEDLRSLKGFSKGDMIEVYLHSDPEKFTWHPMAIMHLNIYITARLWWDVNQDLDAMLNEYYRLFYGPAEKEMKAFIEYSEQNWPNMISKIEAIDRAMELLAAARAKAGDTVYGKRIEQVVEVCKPLKQRRVRLGRVNVPVARALPRSKADLMMDGKLDDKKFWNVRSYSLRDVETGRAPKSPTSFLVAWGYDGALYLGITCRDVSSNLNITATQNGDTNIWSGDFVEILIETPVHSYYRIAVSPAGAIVDADMKDGTNLNWSSGATAAAFVGEKAWTLEVCLPAAGEDAQEIDPLNGISGARPNLTFPWSINVCRQRVSKNEIERSAWSPTGSGSFDDVSKFGTVWCK
ncbi:MAG: DUF4838 domain-containing protein [Kiritimatiellia bacterium]